MLKNNYKSSAKVVDGKLILSFPNAINPVVWQMESQEAKASALEVNDNKESGFDLVLKTLKGDRVHVASFAEKDEAVEGLMAASKAMERGQGGGSSRKDGSVPFQVTGGRGFFKGLLWVVGAFVVIFGLMGILNSMSLSARSGGGRAEMARTSPQAVPESGVPVSADDFLRSR